MKKIYFLILISLIFLQCKKQPIHEDKSLYNCQTKDLVIEYKNDTLNNRKTYVNSGSNYFVRFRFDIYQSYFDIDVAVDRVFYNNCKIGDVFGKTKAIKKWISNE